MKAHSIQPMEIKAEERSMRPHTLANFLIRFYPWGKGVAKGELYLLHMQKARSFDGLDDLFSAINCMMDELEQLRALHRAKSFASIGEDCRIRAQNAFECKTENQMPTGEQDLINLVRDAPGLSCIRIIKRQNGCIQGELYFGSGKAAGFTCALELMNLLQSVSDASGAERPRKTDAGDMAAIYERCVLCGRETEVFRELPVVFRKNYIEGCGQLCKSCHNSLYGNFGNSAF